MIRTATEADIQQISEIFEELHSLHVEIESCYYKKPNFSYFLNAVKDILKDDNYYIIVLEEKGVIKGYALYYIKEKDDAIRLPRKIIFIKGFAVRSKYKRQGIGTKLFLHIKNHAEDICCNAIELNVFYENYDAFDFYTEIGFVPALMKLEFKI